MYYVTVTYKLFLGGGIGDRRNGAGLFNGECVGVCIGVRTGGGNGSALGV